MRVGLRVKCPRIELSNGQTSKISSKRFPMEDFRPISKNSISDGIVEQIMEGIRTGRFKPGDRLPCERELVKVFGVGRGAVREALKVLEAMCFILKKHNSIVFSEPTGNGYFTVWLGMRAEVQEAFETRKIMEIELAGLAAERATAEDIEEISKSLVESYDLRQVTACDISFHQSLVKSAKNRVFSKVYKMIGEALFQTHKYHSLLAGQSNGERDVIMRRTFRGHQEILKAIALHDVRRAKKAMKEHLDYAERNLLGRMKGDPSGSILDRSVESGKNRDR
jgi:GntR family transcriptional repressor for pyruvate dehydrogenase complex